MWSKNLGLRHPTPKRTQWLGRSRTTKSIKMTFTSGSSHKKLLPIRPLKPAFTSMQINQSFPKIVNLSSPKTLLTPTCKFKILSKIIFQKKTLSTSKISKICHKKQSIALFWLLFFCQGPQIWLNLRRLLILQVANGKSQFSKKNCEHRTAELLLRRCLLQS